MVVLVGSALRCVDGINTAMAELRVCDCDDRLTIDDCAVPHWLVLHHCAGAAAQP